MILPYTKIVGKPIYELKGQTKIGIVKEVIFQKADFKVSGLLLEHSIFDREKPSVTSADIVEVVNEGVIVKDDDSVSNLKENVRLFESLKNGVYGIGQTVVTKSGKSLGKVIDLYIESTSLSVVKIYAKNIFSERIISSTAIIEIEGKKIVVKENFESIRAVAPITSASLI